MSLSMCSLLISAAACAFFVWFHKYFYYWKNRNVIHDSPSLFIGSLNFLMRKSASDWFIEQYNHFKKRHPSLEYYGIWIFRRPALVVCSPELARRVLVKDFDYFRDRFLGSGKNDPLGGLNIFTVNDPLWSTVRKQLTPVFTSAKLRSLLSMMNFYSRELVDRISTDHVTGDKPVDLRDMFACVTTDIIGAAAFGLTENSVRTDQSALRSITREISTYTLRRGVEFSAIFFVPNLVDVFGFKFFTNDMSEFFKRIFWKVVDERVRQPDTRKKDLLEALIQIKKLSEIEGKTEITDDVIVAQAAIFLQAGFDTSGVFLSYFMLEMAHNMDIQERLYEELKSANCLQNGEVDYTVVKDLPYLSMCFKECLRKYPAMGFLDRITHDDYKVNDKLTLEKGTPVYVNAIGMHYDDKYFPNPMKFDPERFSSERERDIVPFTYMPFGEGPRNCIGIRFAQQSTKMLIVHLLMNFKVTPKRGEPIPETIKFDKRGVFLGPGQRLDINFTKRNE